MFKLVAGQGFLEDREGCWMSVGGWMLGEFWGDKHDCVDPVINAICIQINDLIPTNAERARLIGPRLLDPFGTMGSTEDTRKRLAYYLDFLAPRASGHGCFSLTQAVQYSFGGRLADSISMATLVFRSWLRSSPDMDHLDEAFALVDELIAMGPHAPVEPLPARRDPLEPHHVEH